MCLYLHVFCCYHRKLFLAPAYVALCSSASLVLNNCILSLLFRLFPLLINYFLQHPAPCSLHTLSACDSCSFSTPNCCCLLCLNPGYLSVCHGPRQWNVISKVSVRWLQISIDSDLPPVVVCLQCPQVALITLIRKVNSLQWLHFRVGTWTAQCYLGKVSSQNYWAAILKQGSGLSFPAQRWQQAPWGYNPTRELQ